MEMRTTGMHFTPNPDTTIKVYTEKLIFFSFFYSFLQIEEADDLLKRIDV